jgi:hypothetical protein
MPALPQISNCSPHTTAPSSRQVPYPTLRVGSRVSVSPSGSMAHGPAIGTRGRSLSTSNPTVSSRQYSLGKHQPHQPLQPPVSSLLTLAAKARAICSGRAFGVLSPEPGARAPLSRMRDLARNAKRSPNRVATSTIRLAADAFGSLWHVARPLASVSVPWSFWKTSAWSTLGPFRLTASTAGNPRALLRLGQAGQSRRFRRRRSARRGSPPGTSFTAPLAYTAGSRRPP